RLNPGKNKAIILLAVVYAIALWGYTLGSLYCLLTLDWNWRGVMRPLLPWGIGLLLLDGFVAVNLGVAFLGYRVLAKHPLQCWGMAESHQEESQGLMR